MEKFEPHNSPESNKNNEDQISLERDESQVRLNLDNKTPETVNILKELFFAEKDKKNLIVEEKLNKKEDCTKDIEDFIKIVLDKYNYDRIKMQKILFFHVLTSDRVKDYEEIDLIDLPNNEINTFIKSGLDLEDYHKLMQEKSPQE